MDENALVVIAAADEVRSRLPELPRQGFTVTERLDGVTLAALWAMGQQVV